MQRWTQTLTTLSRERPDEGRRERERESIDSHVTLHNKWTEREEKGWGLGWKGKDNCTSCVIACQVLTLLVNEWNCVHSLAQAPCESYFPSCVSPNVLLLNTHTYTHTYTLGKLTNSQTVKCPILTLKLQCKPVYRVNGNQALHVRGEKERELASVCRCEWVAQVFPDCTELGLASTVAAHRFSLSLSLHASSSALPSLIRFCVLIDWNRRSGLRVQRSQEWREREREHTCIGDRTQIRKE